VKTILKGLVGIYLLLSIAPDARAALATTAVWELQHAGAATNAGCFDPGVGTPGTDRSQSTAPFTAYTDIVAPSTTTITSAATPFSAASVGNCLNVTAGTGWTTGRYEILSVSLGTATVDRAIAVAASIGGTAALGGALDTFANLNADMQNCNSAYVKADATYVVAAGHTWNFSAITALTCFPFVEGYTAARGDGGSATMQASAGGFSLWTMGGNNGQYGVVFRNFILDCNAQASCAGLAVANQRFTLENILVKNNRSYGFNFAFGTTGNGMVCRFCAVTGGSSANPAFNMLTSLNDCYYCIAYSTAQPGFRIAFGVCDHCIAANITGAGNFGFFLDQSQCIWVRLTNVVSYNNAGDGIRIVNEGCATEVSPVWIANSIIASNGGYGINLQSGTSNAKNNFEDYNFLYNNTTAARFGLAVGAHSVAGTADPFTNGAANTFTLNSIAGGGVVAKGAGFPGALAIGGVAFGTGALDMGALQSATGGGGGAGLSVWTPLLPE
jgi:hypothetical protein